MTCPRGLSRGENFCLSCPISEYISGDECVSCGENCLLCDSGPNQCAACKKDFTLTPEGNCIEKVEIICDKDQFLKKETCIDCAENCLECLDLDQCSKCNENALLTSAGTCLCKDGFFALEAAGGTCVPCDKDCLTCSEQGACLICPSSFSLNEQGRCACEQESYLDRTSETCKFCPDRCSSCSSETQCTSCKNGDDVVFDGQCRSLFCPDGTFRDKLNKLCENCSSNCASCIETADKCTSCKNSDIEVLLDDHTCLQCDIKRDILLQNSCYCGPSQYF